MNELTLKIDAMAHGGSAVGHDKRGKPVFVPFAIPGETVRVRIPEQTKGVTRATLVEVVKPAPSRTAPRCRHFGICGNCHFQHMTYEAQLTAKREVVVDQLQRVGGVRQPPVEPVLPNPDPYGGLRETELFPVEDGGLGYWSPVERRIFPVRECPILQPRLAEAIADLDVDLPGLRKLTLRMGEDEALLAALEVTDVEPPELAVDFPVSVTIVFPDNTAANLIGETYVIQAVGEQLLRVSAGVPFPPSRPAAELLVGAMRTAAGLSGGERVLEIPGGPGHYTAALAETAAEVVVVEPNSDAVADMVVNLDAFDNIAIYEGYEEEVLPALAMEPDLLLLHPDGPPTEGMWYAVQAMRPPRLLLVGEIGHVAQMCRDVGELGYRLEHVQPVDARPQGFWVDVVAALARH